MTDDRAVYVISVAAELAGVHPQTLRIYERKGLVSPKRTAGNSRRYSPRDIERLREIHDLTQQLGINLAGVQRLLLGLEIDDPHGIRGVRRHQGIGARVPDERSVAFEDENARTNARRQVHAVALVDRHRRDIAVDQAGG